MIHRHAPALGGIWLMIRSEMASPQRGRKGPRGAEALEGLGVHCDVQFEVGTELLQFRNLAVLRVVVFCEESGNTTYARLGI